MSAFPPVPPAPVPQAPITPPDEAKRPSAVGYFAGAGVMVAGIVAGIVLLVIGFSSVAHTFTFPRQVDSSGAITIDRTGPYIVYVIRPDPGNAYVPLYNPSVTVTGPDGSTLYTGLYGGGRSSSSAQYKAEAVATFTADDLGTYHVSAASLRSGDSLGVGDGRKVQTGTIAWGFVVGGLGFLVGLVLIIVTAARRHRAKPYPMVPPGYPTAGYPPAAATRPPVIRRPATHPPVIRPDPRATRHRFLPPGRRHRRRPRSRRRTRSCGSRTRNRVLPPEGRQVP